jgi:hypothetical protein
MSELSQNINEQLAQMPQKQQMYYSSLLAKGEQDIFGTITDIHKTEVPSDLQQPAGLALAALNEMLNGEPAPRAKSTEDAYAHIQSEIDKAEELGDTDRAELLKSSVQDALDSSEKQIAADKQFITDNQEMLEGLVNAGKERFDTAFKETSEKTLSNLKRHMKPEAAERFFAEHEEPKIRGALERVFGI